ncbi:jg1331 [Pararge aegeria aegeria]|uniref:RNA-binding protein NOB1 n=1 Tax=Pararge aegeria aegeria TaxID=348720 RepID=A0A8S4S5M2_9NEOP|nr:jg1331 [Pararge aegeria aegeria]
MSKKVKHLVVDTTAFIRAANLQEIAESAYTVQEVVDEITNDRQRRKLVVLPYDLKVKDVFSENIKFITEFAKKTGDYTSLSATDIKTMINYKLDSIAKPDEKQALSTQGKKSDATENKQVDNDLRNVEITVKDGEEENDDDSKLAEEIANQIKNMDLRDEEDVENCITKVSDDDCDDESESEESDSDNGEWITPNNLKEKRKELEDGVFEEKNVEVACITSDFAMQNVLKQIGLNVTSIDGRVIRQLRTFIFRCTTCFKTTSIMTKLFCPKCGHATLKKVSVSVDEHGNQHIHINGKKPLTGRGKRFSLPTPKGGQHFQYPILTEDQHIHKRFATKIARSKTNALDPDYTAGFSPFVMKDVNSKSAVLGVRADKQDVKYWMKHFSKGKKK